MGFFYSFCFDSWSSVLSPNVQLISESLATNHNGIFGITINLNFIPLSWLSIIYTSVDNIAKTSSILRCTTLRINTWKTTVIHPLKRLKKVEKSFSEPLFWFKFPLFYPWTNIKRTHMSRCPNLIMVWYIPILRKIRAIAATTNCMNWFLFHWWINNVWCHINDMMSNKFANQSKSWIGHSSPCSIETSKNLTVIEEDWS